MLFFGILFVYLLDFLWYEYIHKLLYSHESTSCLNEYSILLHFSVDSTCSKLIHSFTLPHQQILNPLRIMKRINVFCQGLIDRIIVEWNVSRSRFLHLQNKFLQLSTILLSFSQFLLNFLQFLTNLVQLIKSQICNKLHQYQLIRNYH